jgi:hypothetical protein
MKLEYLRGWGNDTTVGINNQFLFEELLNDKEGIGWNRFFEEWLVQEWTRAQQAYCNSIRKKMGSGSDKEAVGYGLGPVGTQKQYTT